MNQSQADLFHKLCEDPSVCNANAYFFAVDGEGTPAIDWMCRKDLAENGSCWCGKLDAALIDGDMCGTTDQLEFRTAVKPETQGVLNDGPESDGSMGE